MSEEFVPEVINGGKKGEYSIKDNLITVDGITTPLSTKLRVAYEIQRQFGNKPYMDVFKEIGNKSIEQQIKFVYTAYVQGLKDTGQTALPLNIFTECLLDNFSIMQIVDCIQAIIEGITRGDMSEAEFEDRREKNLEMRKKLEE
jgi:hypothetical protein